MNNNISANQASEVNNDKGFQDQKKAQFLYKVKQLPSVLIDSGKDSIYKDEQSRIICKFEFTLDFGIISLIHH